MTFDIAQAASRLSASLLGSLRLDGTKAKSLAQGEAQKLAASVATIGDLFASGQIDAEEAKVLLRIQRDASDAVLASLAETSRLAVQRAVSGGLEELVRIAGDALGAPLRSAVLAT